MFWTRTRRQECSVKFWAGGWDDGEPAFEADRLHGELKQYRRSSYNVWFGRFDYYWCDGDMPDFPLNVSLVFADGQAGQARITCWTKHHMGEMILFKAYFVGTLPLE